MRSKVVLMLLALVLAAGMVWAGGQKEAAPGPAPAEEKAPAAKPIKITWSSIAQPEAPHSLAMKKFKFEVERASEGRITVELYFAGQIFTQEQELAAAREGSLAIAYYAPNWIAEFVPYMSMFGAAYTFRSYDHMRAVYDGPIGQKLFEDTVKAVGVRPLAAFYLGTRELNVVQKVGEVRSPQDMKGVKLRVPSSPSWIALGKALGANPTPMSYGEVYMGLKTGAIEGQDNPIFAVWDNKWYEVTKYITLTDHVVDTVWPSINEKLWQSLSGEDRKIITDAMRIALEWNDQEVRKREADFRAKLEGVGIVFVDDPDKDAFQAYARNSYQTESKEISKSWDWDLYEEIQSYAR
ncbi:MAG: DctP family TRAP transporter solute-binding subunit [Spirochaetales bacterium]|nr:DctP family TRAP transporter solute-binding subunit [Spirochaetales bacterium]